MAKITEKEINDLYEECSKNIGKPDIILEILSEPRRKWFKLETTYTHKVILLCPYCNKFSLRMEYFKDFYFHYLNCRYIQL